LRCHGAVESFLERKFEEKESQQAVVRLYLVRFMVTMAVCLPRPRLTPRHFDDYYVMQIEPILHQGVNCASDGLRS
jgi:hypothetical protein